MLIDYLEAFDIDIEMFTKLNSCKGLACHPFYNAEVSKKKKN
jgi:hypothetical protein